MSAVALAGVLVLGFLARWHGIAWDGYAALHPDERHLFMMSRQIFEVLDASPDALRSLGRWWFDETSPVNPHQGDRSYVYGELPLFAGVAVARLTGATDWFAFIPVARTLTAVVDTSTILAVFLAARILATGPAALFSACLYAAMPTALQLANFHTVDVWLTAGAAWALVPMLWLATAPARGRLWPAAALAGLACGLAMASKVTGLLLLVPAAIALTLAAWHTRRVLQALAAAALFATAAFLAFRLANPFAFAGPGFWGLVLSADWLADFAGLRAVTASADFPPNWQWIAGYSTLELLRDFALFGAGPVTMLALLALRWRALGGAGLVLAATVVVYWLMMDLSSVSALRYAAPALPALAALVAPAALRLGPWAAGALLVAALWWGAGVVRLHDGAHPRVLASLWLWNQPQGADVTNETAWDDTLPTIVRLSPDEAFRWPSHGDWFTFHSLDITDPDSPEKADRMARILAQTDFLVLSSDRQSGVMPRLPTRFPMTTAHYVALFNGNACFSPAFVQRRGYPLPFLGFDDSWAQEPWRVYDHPDVWIFRRRPCFDEGLYAAYLRRALGVGARH